MIDARLRTSVSRALAPLAARASRVHPVLISVFGALVGLSAAAFVAIGAHWIALGCWLANRILDGIDGAVARRSGRASDLGGYLDMLLDTIVYSAIPIGIAVFVAEPHTWALCAGLLAAFYINITSWTYLAALLEKRGRGAATTGEQTSVTMPGGLVEGAETIALFAICLAFPQFASWGFALMIVAVAITIAQRVLWAKRHLK